MKKRQYISITDPRFVYAGNRTTPVILTRTRNEVAQWLKDARRHSKNAPKSIAVTKVDNGYLRTICGHYDMMVSV
jgi:hypothetical protein